MADCAAEVKRRVSAPDMAARYGVEADSRGYARCPFHAERTGSLRLYEGERGWHCFGCGKGGSVIDFVMAYFSLPFLPAVKKLNQDFGLGLPMDRPMDYRERLRAARESMARRREAEAQARARRRAEDEYEREADRLALLDRWLQDYRPKSPDEEWHPLFACALHEIENRREALEAAEYERWLACRTH